MEDIEAEIQEKVIEKVVEEELKPVKQKKPRTEAQKAAFEKARAKRMDNLKKKQEEEVTAQVEDKPVLAPKRRGRPRGNIVKEQIPVRPEPVNHPVYQPVNHGIPFNQNIPQNYYQWSPQPMPQQPQPVNNYYYYGVSAPSAPTPQHRDPDPRSLQPIELVEDSSSEEEYEYIQEKYNAPRPQPKLQFRFA